MTPVSGIDSSSDGIGYLAPWLQAIDAKHLASIVLRPKNQALIKKPDLQIGLF